MGVPYQAWVVDDPYDITPSLQQRFPVPPNESQHYLVIHHAAFDWRRYQVERKAHRTSVAIGLVGGGIGEGGRIAVAKFEDRLATTFGVGSPGADYYGLSFVERGAGRLRQRRGEVDMGAGCATMFRADANTFLDSSDEGSRLTVWLPGPLLRRRASVLADTDVASLDFAPLIASRHRAGGELHRLATFAQAELARPDSLLLNPAAAAPLEELLLSSILMGLPHTRFEGLRRQGAPAPRSIRRAEAFMRAHAEEALTVERIAAAAGCSVRALQLGFRRFRETTPMALLREVRLERARYAFVRADCAVSVLEIAGRYGFANAGRFSALYRRKYGELPSGTLRDAARHE